LQNGIVLGEWEVVCGRGSEERHQSFVWVSSLDFAIMKKKKKKKGLP
jgi:hypothetical protein